MWDGVRSVRRGVVDVEGFCDGLELDVDGDVAG